MTPTAQEQVDILERLRDGVIEYDEGAVIQAAREAMAVGMDASQAVLHGLAAGMEAAGLLVADGEYFVPEVSKCASAMYSGLSILCPRLTPELAKMVKAAKGIGEEDGDIHDIGKDLTRIMFEVAGLTAHGPGHDMPVDQFRRKCLEIVLGRAREWTRQRMLGRPRRPVVEP